MKITHSHVHEITMSESKEPDMRISLVGSSTERAILLFILGDDVAYHRPTQAQLVELRDWLDGRIKEIFGGES